MDNITFAAISRRLSLIVLGAAGAVAVSGAAPAEAKNKAKKKLRRKQQQKCVNQAEACITLFNRLCEEDNEGDPDEIQQCIDASLPCCERLASCDFAAFTACAD